MFAVNEYFDGKVKSIAFNSVDGPATIGVMAAGEYTFNTSSIELMSITSGEMQARLPDSNEWHSYHAGDNFRVEANQSFDVKMTSEVAYLCVYKNS